ncbi:ExbD/TolR family protein [Celeribacter litoreus]|uniref:ExbD/TolR family protein n=1 Tax=Celeribacter litoreus TaxID=2876714 RepID=UPI001CCE8253|nr:biopolymer transporter ExbD [Celeribacter litoreus]MCA0043961.1 biopolymer transporter ExbD [Celeribacter litoreus]
MRRERVKPEPTIALINVVFLMLVFFLVAGTLAQPLDRDVTLVRTSGLDADSPPDALVVRADGAMSYRGAPVESLERFLAREVGEGVAEVRVVPDRELPAEALVKIGAELRALDVSKVVIVTERGLR